jgi:hypothetical protein
VLVVSLAWVVVIVVSRLRRKGREMFMRCQAIGSQIGSREAKGWSSEPGMRWQHRCCHTCRYLAPRVEVADWHVDRVAVTLVFKERCTHIRVACELRWSALGQARREPARQACAVKGQGSDKSKSARTDGVRTNAARRSCVRQVFQY